MKTDDIDAILIKALRENARASTADLARKLGRSRTTIQARIERLERVGVITGYTVLTSAEYERRSVRAHVLIKVAPKTAAGVERAIRNLPSVSVLYSVSGEFDMIAVVGAVAVSDLDEAIDAIGQMSGVERTNSVILLATRFER